MDATNILIGLGEKLKAQQHNSDSIAAQKLLDWFGLGGFETLKTGAVAFLTAAIKYPAGSSFVLEEKKVLPQLALAEQVRGRYATMANIEATLHSEHNSTALAACATGLGWTPEQVVSGTPTWRDDFAALKPNVRDDYDLSFLAGFGDKELTTRGLRISDIQTVLSSDDNPFPIRYQGGGDFARDFGRYLAGTGYTEATIPYLSAPIMLKLIEEFTRHGEPEGFEAFIAGIEFVAP